MIESCVKKCPKEKIQRKIVLYYDPAGELNPRPPCLRADTLQQGHRALSAADSFFHSLGAKRAESLGRLDRCPVFFSSGSDRIPVFGDLSA